jgi:hypothetical protein
MPIWVRLPNVPLEYRDAKSLEAIGNSFGRFISLTPEMTKLLGLFIARICVQVNMQINLPANLILDCKSRQLDFELVAFRCQ